MHVRYSTDDGMAASGMAASSSVQPKKIFSTSSSSSSSSTLHDKHVLTECSGDDDADR